MNSQIKNQKPKTKKTAIGVSLVFGFCFLISPLWAAPALTGFAIAADSIFWSWTPQDPNSTFTLLNSTGGVVRLFSAGNSFNTTEGSLPPGTAIQRKIQQTDPAAVITTTSPLVTVGTPDSSVVVPFGSPATVVGTDKLTRASLSAGAIPGQGQLSVSADPVGLPLINTTPALIALANAKPPANRTLVTAALREFTVIATGDLFTGAFSAPATIQIPYSDARNTGNVDGTSPAIPVQTLALYTIDPAQGLWVPVPGASLDTANKVIIANVTHFSVYGIFGVAGPNNLATLKVFPNPWRPGSGGSFDDPKGIHFLGLSPTATIKIFTIRGDIVRRIDKQITDGNEILWDGKNSDGDKAVSGIYFFLVTDPVSGQQVKDRLGVIR